MKVQTKFDALEMMIDAYKNFIERTEEFKNWFVDNFYGESMKLNTFVKDILKLCEKRENNYAKSMVSLLEMFNSYSLIKPICEENNYNFHEYFEHNDEHEVHAQQLAMAIEEGVVHYRIPLGIAGAVEQQLDGIVTFTIEGRKKEYQYAQHHAAKRQFLIRGLEFAKHTFHAVHGAGEIE